MTTVVRGTEQRHRRKAWRLRLVIVAVAVVAHAVQPAWAGPGTALPPSQPAPTPVVAAATETTEPGGALVEARTGIPMPSRCLNDENEAATCDVGLVVWAIGVIGALIGLIIWSWPYMRGKVYRAPPDRSVPPARPPANPRQPPPPEA